MKKSDSTHYVLNRRATFVLGAAFFVVGLAIGALVFFRLSPQRRLHHLQDSVHDYIEQEKWPQAAIQLRNIIQIAPDDVDALVRLGETQLRLYEEAVQGPEGTSIRGAGALDAAVACFRRAAELQPDHASAQRWLLQFSLRIGDWEEATRRLHALEATGNRHPLLALAREIIPTRHAEAVRRGRELLAAEQFSEAVAVAQAVYDPENIDVSVLEIVCLGYARQDDAESWERLLDQAERRIGISYRLHLNRAECLLTHGRLDDAEHYAARAKRAVHVETPACFLLAEIHSRRANEADDATPHLEAAASEYRQVLARNPWNQRAANNLAWVLGERLRRIAEGLEISGTALAAVETPESKLLDTHGWLLFQSGEVARAILFLERAAQADPADPMIRMHLASAYRKAGRSEESVTRLLESAVRAQRQRRTLDKAGTTPMWQRTQAYLPPDADFRQTASPRGSKPLDAGQQP